LTDYDFGLAEVPEVAHFTSGNLEFAKIGPILSNEINRRW